MRVLTAAIALTLLSVPARTQNARAALQPFTATLKSRYWTESGRTTDDSKRFARAKYGSYAFESKVEAPDSMDQGERGFFRYAFNAPRRLFIFAESLVQAAVVRPIVDDKEMENIIQAYGTCESLKDGSRKALGRSTILGFDVIEVEVERDDRSVIEEWVAPDLQCFALKRIEILDGELRVKVEAVSVQTEEPEASNFQAPAGYAIVSPLEIEDLYRARFPGRELFGSNVYKMEDQYRRGIANSKK